MIDSHRIVKYVIIPKLSKIYLILILIPLLLCAGIYLVFQLNWKFRRNSTQANMLFGRARKVVDRISCKPSVHLYDKGASTVDMSHKYEVFLNAIYICLDKGSRH